jgi:hypothetical protein
VSANLDAERAIAEDTRNEYLDKMEAHTTSTKHSLGLDNMMGENKVELDGREWDLTLREAVLVEAQSQGLNPRDNHKELMEFVELRRLLQDTEVDHITEVGWLTILARDVSMVLVDPPRPTHGWQRLRGGGRPLGAPVRGPCSGHGPLDWAPLICRCRLRHPTCTSILFCFHFIS